jgi:hypothetical protein
MPACSSVAIYGQCGGLGYTGCTTCASGSTCQVGNTCELASGIPCLACSDPRPQTTRSASECSCSKMSRSYRECTLDLGSIVCRKCILFLTEYVRLHTDAPSALPSFDVKHLITALNGTTINAKYRQHSSSCTGNLRIDTGVLCDVYIARAVGPQRREVTGDLALAWLEAARIRGGVRINASAAHALRDFRE